MSNEAHYVLVGKLTNLGKETVESFFRQIILASSYELLSSINDNNIIHEISLGEYGSLLVSSSDSTIGYSFKPSDYFNEMVRKAFIEKESLLIEEVEKKFIETIKKTYRGML